MLNSRTIAGDRLALADVPDDVADGQALIGFAHTSNARSRWGSFRRCAKVAKQRDHSSLDAPRTCPFFEARRWRDLGASPDAGALAYRRDLVAGIRAHLLAREAAPAGTAQP